MGHIPCYILLAPAVLSLHACSQCSLRYSHHLGCKHHAPQSGLDLPVFTPPCLYTFLSPHQHLHLQGASEDILAAKNTLYQYLTWDADKATSLCSKLAQPLATPVVTSPPMSPRHEGEETARGVCVLFAC